MTVLRSDIETMDFSDIAEVGTADPVTPGEILRHEFMEPLGLSAYALAKAINVPANRIQAILHGTRAITADTAIRLSQHFGTTAEMWMALQTNYDLALARLAMTA